LKWVAVTFSYLVEVGGTPGDPTHRNDSANIMSASTGAVPENLFYFDPREIVSFRKRIQSPGSFYV